MSINFRPLHKRVVIKHLEEESVSTGGLFIPEAAKEKSQIAEVMALGTEDNFSVKVGDKVMVGKYCGDDIKLDGEECKIVYENDILGVVED